MPNLEVSKQFNKFSLEASKSKAHFGNFVLRPILAW